MLENRSAHHGQSAGIDSAFEEKPQVSHGDARTSLDVTNINGQKKGSFCSFPSERPFQVSLTLTQYSFGGKHVNRCNIKYSFSQALNFPWHALLHSCKISYDSVGEIPVLHDQTQNSHPLQQGWTFTQSLIPSCLFLAGGGSLH